MGLIDTLKDKAKDWLLTHALKKGATQAVLKLAALLIAAKVAQPLSDGKVVIDLDAAAQGAIAGVVLLLEVARNGLKFLSKKDG